MGIHYLPQLVNYWENSSIYRNELPNYISKNQFKFLSWTFHLPVGDLNPHIFEDENNNDNLKENDFFDFDSETEKQSSVL